MVGARRYGKAGQRSAPNNHSVRKKLKKAVSHAKYMRMEAAQRFFQERFKRLERCIQESDWLGFYKHLKAEGEEKKSDDILIER